MRVQELYNQYCSKEITVESFLYHVRRDPILKEFISPVNSAEDVILILKQRVGITEQVSEDMIIQEKGSEDEEGEDIKDSPDADEDLDEYRDGDEDRYQEIDEKYGNDEVRDILEKYKNLGFDLPGEAINAILTHKDWAERWDVSDSSDIQKIKSWKDDIIRKKKSMNEAKKPKPTVDDVNPYEFRKGWKYEYDCDPKIQKDQNIDKAKEIALRNVITDPIYYSNLFSKNPGAEKPKTAKPVKDAAVKATPDKVELKDKVNQMKPVAKGKGDKSNVKTNMSKQEKAKGAPKGVKTMKLKESIRKELRSLLEGNDAYNNHVEALRDIVKMKPEDLAKQVIDGKLPMSGMRKEFTAKVLGKHVADGNKSPEVEKAFHKLTDHLNEDLEVGGNGKLDDSKLKSSSDQLIQKYGSEQKAIEFIDKRIEGLEKEQDKKSASVFINKWNQIKSYMTGKTEEPVKANPNTFSTNEEINTKVVKKAEEMARIAGSKEKAIAVCDQKIKDAERENSEKLKKATISLYTQVKSILSGKTEDPVKADTKTFSANESTDTLTFEEIKDAAEKLLKQFDGDKKKAIERCDYAIDVIKHDQGPQKNKERSSDKFKKVKSYLKGDRNLKVSAEKDVFSTNERVTIGDFDTWKGSVISLLQKTLKTDDKAALKIFNHYQKDFKKNHEAGKDAKTAVKEFGKNLKKLKEDTGGMRGFDYMTSLLDKAKDEKVDSAKKALIDKAIGVMSLKDFKSKGGLDKLKDHPLLKDVLKRYSERDDLAEEFEGNTPPKEADYQDTELENKKK